MAAAGREGSDAMTRRSKLTALLAVAAVAAATLLRRDAGSRAVPL
jgi:hypothetical protein